MKGDARTSFSLAELAGRFGGTVMGDAEVRIRQIAPLETAGPGDLSFLTNPKYRRQLAGTRAAAVLLPEGAADATTLPRIVCKNPYATYARIAALINPEARPAAGVHASAVVDPGARVAASASIGPCAVVGAGAVVGEEAVIGAHCFVGEGARIGARSRLHAHVTVYHGCELGARVIVHSGAVIGADGFGMAMDDGRWLKIPQIGRVLVGDDVEIGANTTIDRGAMDDTVIEEGVKLDNQIQIGHNCRIGAHTAIAGCAAIAGSTRIGRHCMLGGGSMISGHLTIADRTVISGGSPVFKSIEEPGGTFTGLYPLQAHADWVRNASTLRRLHDLADRVRGLEAAIKKNEGGST
ncbi:MAG TPA: UDP-3-O-(3-hydroxymyristoyl)glucosamine N-acyltransferase [Burkholderiales bacterium]|nr:UDP-3-O-(3-hydroxymyristoyl)glucosamine N-acyltransferase [Burkholderiales bacterium]